MRHQVVLVSILSICCGWIVFVIWLPRDDGINGIHFYSLSQSSTIKNMMVQDFSSIDGIVVYGSDWVSVIDLVHNASTRSSAIVEVQLIPQQANVGHIHPYSTTQISINMHKLWRIQWNCPLIHRKNTPWSEASTAWWPGQLALSRTPAIRQSKWPTETSGHPDDLFWIMRNPVAMIIIIWYHIYIYIQYTIDTSIVVVEDVPIVQWWTIKPNHSMFCKSDCRSIRDHLSLASNPNPCQLMNH